MAGDLELRHLALLRDLAEHGSLTAVAARTHRTPSALSQQLRTATAEAGTALVEPHARGVRLTPAGRLLADGADAVLTELARLRARLDASIGEPRGAVSIATLPSAGTVLLPPLLARLADTAITLTLDDLDVAEAEFAVRAGEVDLVIAHSPVGAPPSHGDRVRVVPLAVEPLDIALPADHPLAARVVLRPEDLRGTTWVGVPRGYPFDALVVALEQTLGEPLERAVRVRDNQLVRALVGAGVGLAVLPRFTTPAGPSSDSPDVVIRPLHGVQSRRRIVALVRPDTAERLAVRAVLDALRDVGAAVTDEADRGDLSRP